MKTLPTASKRTNLDLKQVIIPFPRPETKEPRERTISNLQAKYYSCGCHLASLQAFCTLLQ
eukprot:8208117-Ditylum_brightwellii.AAC.1